MKEDNDQSYVALAMSLLQALRGGQRAQAAALAQQMQQRFGDRAGAAGKLLEVLNDVQEDEEDEEEGGGKEEEEEDEEEVEESEDSVDEEATESSGSSSSSGEDSVEDGNVSEALRSLVERLPSPTALPGITNIKPDTTSGGKTVEVIKEGIDEIDEGESEEERRIFASIAGTVDAEMKRLAIVRKHR